MFFGGHDGLGAADIDDSGFAFEAKDHTINDGIQFVAIFGEDGVFFGLANPLENNLFGGLGGDAAESRRSNVFVLRVKNFGFTGVGIQFDGVTLKFFFGKGGVFAESG